ncbi:MAG: c-type cytochrome [Gemmatimonadales bacterium]
MRERAVVLGLLALALLAVGAIGGLAVAASGIVSIRASSGHWAVTEWLLQLGKRRSVDMHTLGDEQPDLSAPWLVLKGAGHYESGCRPCHGSPDLPVPRIAAGMTPLPPYLPPRIASWEPRELFYIVKHGIKFTGMPAWWSQERDDEVAAIVAFLLAMPEMDGTAYLQLVHGEEPHEPAVVPLEDLTTPPPPRAVSASCARCHGADGLGRGSAAFPKLAGQRVAYLERSLEAFANGERNSGFMEPVAAALTDAERRELAEYYAALPAGADTEADASTDAAAGDPRNGRGIVSAGVPELGVPSCMDCHGPTDYARNPAYPVLEGQYADYLVLQLELFAGRRRGGSAYAPLMHHVVDGLDEQQMRDVAAFYASRVPSEASAP